MTGQLNKDTIIKLREFFKKFPEINLGDITLRDMRLSDQDKYFDYLTHPEVQKFLSDEDIPDTRADALEIVKMWGSLFYKKNGVFWTIADSKTDQLIGSIGLVGWNFYNRRAELSYDIHYDYWGKGIATKAISNILKLAFNEMLLFRIEARTMTGNKVSQHLLNKFHFKQEGLMKAYRFIRGQFEDVLLYSLVKPDYPAILLQS
jgi:ribosomal-protein-alanine N-acetyltransferase